MRIPVGNLPYLLLAIATASTSHGAMAAPPTPEQIEFFEKSVRPLLVANCDRCHSSSATKVKGGLRLDSLAGILKGGDTGPAVIPGDVDHSLLITAIRYGNPDLEMPPKTKLPPEAIKVLEQWVKMGAPHPDALVPAGQPVVVQKSGIDIAKGRQFWSYVAPHKAAPPLVNDGAWVYS
ncbi:MAG: c-type cytochrome domain-containing protein, partial [Planctomycetota bacterium]